MSVGTRGGPPVLRVASADDFVTAIGRPHDEPWDERFWNADVRIDNDLASVWTDYAPYHGPTSATAAWMSFSSFGGRTGGRSSRLHTRDT